MNGTVGSYAIGQVAELLGVPPPTIRSWERRHGVPHAARTRAGHRRYDTSDVAALQRMRDELAAGRGAAEAAAIARSVQRDTAPVLVEQLCAAAHDLDPAAITAVLDQACVVHGRTAALELVLLPAMRELGRQWAVGACDVAQEHLASGTVQGWLRTAARSAAPDGGPPVVLACGPDEQHTLALDALAVLLAHAGVRCLNLGARVPARSLVEVVERTGARAVVLSCQVARGRRSATAALQAVAEGSAAVHYGGAAFDRPAARRGVPGHYLGVSLGRAVDQLTRP